MKIVCLSAANILVARHNSASVKTCEIIRDLALARRPGAEVEIIPLLDYDLKPCFMCGDCTLSQRCPVDEAFNCVFEKMIAADAIFAVVPHYAPFPSKVMILLEKMEEMVYLGYTNDEKRYVAPLNGKPFGLVGHGGQTAPEAVAYYQKALVEPLAMAFMSCGLRVIPADGRRKYGVSFGIRSLSKIEGSVFVAIEHDWNQVRQAVTPLVKNVMDALPA